MECPVRAPGWEAFANPSNLTRNPRNIPRNRTRTSLRTDRVAQNNCRALVAPQWNSRRALLGPAPKWCMLQLLTQCAAEADASAGSLLKQGRSNDATGPV